ncbi:hypothetical protein [Pseudomonas sp. NCCP-436]|uniref:hypothetical protein n=1 Tax=Pseudomonas sp. NCCP-436 TaxID=2842481 RepID=UPI001C81B797|nr:hypothetical protein [Pseudomonas sp. NCCP-436]GIZ13360.1 hypothetical protein NCCP436_27760 [Pseudomonas sp. NCCP-436]
MSNRRSLVLPLSALLVFLFAFFYPTLPQASPADDLLHLHQMRLALQRSLGDFYMYNSMEGDQRYARQISDALQEGQNNLERLGQMPGHASTELQTQLLAGWQRYRQGLLKLMEAMRNQGYTELQPVADLAETNQKLMQLSQQLYQQIQQDSGEAVPPLTQVSREQSLLMQGMAADYASRSASIGNSFFGGGEERALDELAGQFASRLDKLANAPQNTPQISSALQNITTKWRYIEKSLRNYNENSVPFLISKYSDSIIEGLEDVSAQYAARQL